MADAAALHDALQTIAEQTDDDMSERDVENLFLEREFYDALDYEGTGTDLRSEFTLPDDRRPDYITLDTNEAVTAVYEFKTTGRDLQPHEEQLFHYMDFLRAEYGILTNGEQLRLYRRGDSRAVLSVSMAAVTESEARDLVSALQKRKFDLKDPADVNQFLEDLDPIPLDAQAELGQEHFFDTFRLEDGSPFADLVTGMMDLLHELRDDQEAKFVKGAYDFWEATYADEPDEVPTSWDPFINGKQSLRDFMFCLESGHALLARLLLAKATEDHDFFAGTGYEGMDDYFRGLQGFGDTINLDAFPVAADNLIDDMQDQLVEGLFQDDIFIWWTDGYAEQLSRGHESGPNQFEAVAKETGGVERVSEATRDRFSRAVAEVFFNVLRFDFEDVEGDLLGDLYQRYFDPETRKALGEFYTPQPVIDYIMDGVGYERGVSNERLIDPSCGSGTFLVEAVERYIADVETFEDDPDWEEHLRDLCTRPRIVGLDIHPFAVLMAQIRFVVAILPAYRQAKTQNPEFTLRRLPIYRTDTLRNERELTGADLGDDGTRQMTFDAMTEDDQDVRIPVPLPVEVDEDDPVETEDGFLVRRVRMPLFDTIQLETGVNNFGEYFAALQGVLDTVKDHMALAEEFGGDFDWEYKSGLEERINQHTSRDYSGVEDFFAPYVDDMLENVRYLKEEHNDGRLFKMFEDTVLALVVKNYMEYDYVVGNPPYVRQENLRKSNKEMYEQLYPDVYDGRGDISVYFLKRATELAKDAADVGVITSINFTTSNYGEGIRNFLSDNVSISEVINFSDTKVFEDATAYPMTFLFSNTPPEDEHTFRTCFVDSSVESQENPMEYIFSNLDGDDEYCISYNVTQSRLGDDSWRFVPDPLYEVTEKVQKEATHTVEDIANVVTGIRAGLNDAFIIDMDTAEEHGIESEVLKECLKAKDTERYHIPHTDRRVIYTPILDPKVHKNAYEWISQFEDDLRDREQFKGRDDMEWWEIEQPVSRNVFEEEKLITPAFSKRNSFAYDLRDLYHVDMVMSVVFNGTYDTADHRYHVLGVLNSKVVEIVFKQSATLIQGKYYRYYQQQIRPLPLVLPEDIDNSELSDTVRQIVEAKHLNEKIGQFPDEYIQKIDSEVEYIDYTWQTRRYPVDAEVQENTDGDFTVQAGRSDTINDPAMYADDREARKRRAEYVHAAVDGRNVKSGEETTIPIPRSDDDVAKLLDRLEADREDVRQTEIEELEAEIDDAVYDLFDLTDEEREVVEDYLEVF